MRWGEWAWPDSRAAGQLGGWEGAAVWPGGAEEGRPVCSLGRRVSEEGLAEPILPPATLADATLEEPQPDLAEPMR